MKELCGGEFYSYGYFVGQWGREEIGGLSNRMSKSQGKYGRDFVSFLFSNIPRIQLTSATIGLMPKHT